MSRQVMWALFALVAAVLLPLLFAGDSALLVRSNYAVNIGVLILLSAYLGQAWNIAGGFAGLTSFGHALFFGTGAYCSTMMQAYFGINAWVSWGIATVVGGVLGGLLGYLVCRAGLRGSYFALVTLAFAEAFRVLALAVPFTKRGLGMLIPLDPRFSNLQFANPIWFYYLALALCVISIMIAWGLTRSRFGASLVAIRENEDAARALGIDTLREKVKCLALSGAMCAAGGTFYAQKYLYIDPIIAYGVDKSVEMLLVSMIGGLGTVFGPLIGATVLVLLGEVTRMVSNTQGLSLIVYGAILVVIVALMPQGLVGLFRRKTRHA